MSPHCSEPLCKLHLRYVKVPLWHKHPSPTPHRGHQAAAVSTVQPQHFPTGSILQYTCPRLLWNKLSQTPHYRTGQETAASSRQRRPGRRLDWLHSIPPGLLPRAGGNGSGCSSCPKALQPWDHWRREGASAHLQWLLNVTCATKGSRDRHWC